MTLITSSKTNPNKLAGAIAENLKNTNTVEIQSVGAGSLNQSIKAIAIARGYLAPMGKDLVCVPTFSNVMIEGESRTAIKLILKVLQ